MPNHHGGGTGTYPYEIEGGVHGELQCGSYLLMDGQYNGALSGGWGGDAVSVDTRVEGGDGRPGRGEGTGHGAFQSALFVHATVLSAKGGKRVIDAGSKAIDLLGGFPIAVAPVWGSPGKPHAGGGVHLTGSAGGGTGGGTDVGTDVGTVVGTSGGTSAGCTNGGASLLPSLRPPPLRPLCGAGGDVVQFSMGGDEHGVLNGVATGDLPIGSTVQLIPSHCDPTVNLHEYYVCMRQGNTSGCAATVEDVWRIDARGPGI